MKLTSTKAFEKHISDAAPDHFVPVYLILSKDLSGQKAQIKQLMNSLGIKSITTFDGNQKPHDSIIDELRAFSLFAERRIVVIYHADKLGKMHQSQLTDYFKNPNPSIYLILSAASINRSTKFYKNAEKVGVILDLSEKKPWETEKSLVEHVIAQLSRERKKIDHAVAQLLVKQVGADATLLHHELEKILAYVGNRQEITRQDITTIGCGINHESIWQLGDAIFTRDSTTALRISKALVGDGAALLSLIRQIRAQFQTRYQVCSIITGGGTSAQVTQKFPYMRGNILQRTIETARNYGMHRFKKGMLEIDKTELTFKNSVIHPDLLLEMLMVKLTC